MGSTELFSSEFGRVDVQYSLPAGVALYGGHRPPSFVWNGFKAGDGVATSVHPEDEPPKREPRLARRSPFTPAQKLCPKCLAPLKGSGGLGGWLIPMNYYCPRCGYSGTVFIEKDNEGDEGKS